MAIRALRRSPGTAASAIIILSVGIGASVAMLTVFRTVLIQRLPVADPDKLIVLSLLSTTDASPRSRRASRSRHGRRAVTTASLP
jgi:hypothetical protein